jgi:hypothetical protein
MAITGGTATPCRLTKKNQHADEEWIRQLTTVLAEKSSPVAHRSSPQPAHTATPRPLTPLLLILVLVLVRSPKSQVTR